jgi:hypothetical protein
MSRNLPLSQLNPAAVTNDGLIWVVLLSNPGELTINDLTELCENLRRALPGDNVTVDYNADGNSTRLLVYRGDTLDDKTWKQVLEQTVGYQQGPVSAPAPSEPAEQDVPDDQPTDKADKKSQGKDKKSKKKAKKSKKNDAKDGKSGGKKVTKTSPPTQAGPKPQHGVTIDPQPGKFVPPSGMDLSSIPPELVTVIVERFIAGFLGLVADDGKIEFDLNSQAQSSASTGFRLAIPLNNGTTHVIEHVTTS